MKMNTFRSAVNTKQLVAILSVAALALSAPAATWYWDGGTQTSNTQSDNTTTTGQNWLSGGYWDNGTSQTLASWTAGDSAIFGGTAASQTITAGTFTIGNLTFGGGADGSGTSGTAYTISSGTLTFGASGTTITANTATTINSALAGSTAFTKAGGATLTLTYRNTFSGSTTVSAGTLRLNDARSMNGAMTVSSGAYLTIENNNNGGYFQPSSLTVNGGTVNGVQTAYSRYHGIYTTAINTSGTSTISTPVYISKSGSTTTETLTVDVASGGTTTISGTILNHPDLSGGLLTKTGAGTLILSGGALYSGNSATLTGNVTINGGILAANYAANNTNPTATALGNMTTSGRTITVNSGATLRFGAADAIGSVGYKTPVTIIADGGTITRVNGSFNSIGDVTLKNGAHLTTATGQNGTVNSLEINGNVTVSGTSGSFIDTTGASYTGLHLYGTGLSGASGTTTFDVGVTGSAVDLTVSAPLINGYSATSSLLKSGTGTMSLSAANAYTGATTVQAGALVAGTNSAVSTNGAFGNASSALVLGNDLTGASDAPAILINGAYTVARAITVGSVANSAAYTPILGGSNTSGTATFTGNITLNTTATNYTGLTLKAATGGTVEFKTGTWTTNNKAITIGTSGNTGTVKLTNAFATTGGVSINYGTLLLGTANALGSSTTPVTMGGGTFDLNGLADTVGTLSGGSGSITGGASSALTVTQASDATYGGTIGGSVALTKAGASALTLSGTNSYTGATAVNNGALNVTGSLAAGSAVTVASGATLGGTGTVNGGVTVNSGGILTPGTSGSGTLTLGSLTLGSSAGHTATINIGVSGTPGSATTSSSLQVNGNVTPNGGNGTVTFAFGSALGNLGNGTYHLISYTGTQLGDINAFTYSGTAGAREGVTLLNNTGYVDVSITTAYPIWKGTTTDWSGATAWKLNTNSSDTSFLANDTVHFDSSASSGTVNLTANVNPLSVTFEGDSLAYTLGSSGGYWITTGSLAKTGSSSVTINTANTFSGGTTLSAGTLKVGNDSALGTGSVAMNGGTLSSDSTTSRSLTNNITIGGNITLGDATNTGALALSGTVSLGGATRQLTTASDVTMSGVVSNGGLTKAGSGALTLSNSSNTYAGGTTLSSGTLTAGSNSAFGTGSIALNGGTLDVNGKSLANNITLNGGAIAGNGGTLSGVIANGSSTTLAVGSNLTVSGVNTYSGATTISAGTFEISGSGSLGSGSYAGNISNAGTLKVNSTATQTLSGTISGAGTLVKDNTGALTLTGASSLTGNVTINGGIVVVNSTNNNTNPTTTALGNMTTSGRTITVNSGATLRFAAADSIGAYNYVTPVAIVADGGTIARVYTDSSNYFNSLGNVTLNNGAHLTTANGKSADVNSIGLNGTLTVSGTTGSYIDTTGSSFNGIHLGYQTGTTTFDVGDTTSAVDLAVTAPLLNPTVPTGKTAGLLKTGAGTMQLSAANTFSGNMTISGGTVLANLTVNSTSPTATALGDMTTSGRTITVNSGATLRFDLSDAIGAYNYKTPVKLIADGGTITRISGAGTFNSIGDVELKNGGHLTITNGNQPLNVSVGSFGLNGDVTISGTSASFIDVAAGQTTNTYIDLGYNGDGRASTTFTVGDVTSNSDVDLTVSAALADKTLTGAAGLTKAGSGTMLLSGANTYSGNTTISAGALKITGGIYTDTYRNVVVTVQNGAVLELNNWGYGASQSLGNLTANATGMSLNNATIRMNNTSATSYGRGATVNGPLTLDANGSATWTIDTTNDSQAWTYSNNPNLTLTGTGVGVFQKVINSGSGTLVKSGAGTWTLSGANTYTGTTTINAGTLELSGGSAIADTGAVSLANVAGAILKLSSNETVGSLAGGGGNGGNVNLQGNMLTVGDANNTSYGGVISGSGGQLTKQGAGTLTLSGANTYTGNTSIVAGVVELTGSGSISGSPVIDVQADATLDVSGTTGTYTIADGQTLKGRGTVNGALIMASGSTLAPGSSPGKLIKSEDLTLSEGSIVAIEIAGTTPGTEYDQVSFTSGALELNQATLSVTLSYTPTPYMDSFIIFSGFSSLTGLGYFKDLPTSGSTLQADYAGKTYTMSIAYGLDNITLSVIPEPGTAGVVATFLAAALLRRRRFG